MQRLRVTENFINFCNSLCDVGPSVEVWIILLCVCENFNSQTINEIRIFFFPCFSFAIFTLVFIKADLQLLCFFPLEIAAYFDISWVFKAPTTVQKYVYPLLFQYLMIQVEVLTILSLTFSNLVTFYNDCVCFVYKYCIGLHG